MKIRIKSGDCPSYLTVGKVYEAERKSDLSFLLGDDNGCVWTCSLKNCVVLGGGSWEIVND